jgi:hypothetical protein
MAPAPPTVFLLSPANCAGKRAGMLLRSQANFALARALRSAHGTSLGEAFTFMSGLYFRGKLNYAQRFAQPMAASSGTLVITPGRGLCPSWQMVTHGDLLELARVEVDANNAAFVEPLCRDASALAQRVPAECRIVLLGSIATPKYVEPLLQIFGSRLLFPSAFVGRGDMSRGGLMLRCARDGEELAYEPVEGAVRHGKRPPRLPVLPRALRAVDEP